MMTREDVTDLAANLAIIARIAAETGITMEQALRAIVLAAEYFQQRQAEKEIAAQATVVPTSKAAH